MVEILSHTIIFNYYCRVYDYFEINEVAAVQVRQQAFVAHNEAFISVVW